MKLVNVESLWCFNLIIDKDFDDYEIGSSFIVEEPFSAPKPKDRRVGDNSKGVYWTTELLHKDEVRESLCISA
jgi:hypothetical protein